MDMTRLTVGETKQAGRPRREEISEKARGAAIRLARELGAEKVTMEGVASQSGVAKTTLYRRWPSAPHLVMDAFLADLHPLIAYRHGETLRQTLIYALTDLASALDSKRRELLCHLIGAAQSNSQLRQAFWESWIRPRREEGLKAMAAAGVIRERGEVILDLLFGAFYYRMLIPYAPIDAEWIKAIVGNVLPDETPEK
ncbi:TetR/AcrR family transcriptional regulator [Neorhizobium sp. CSC1952]|uniref:TetR/AcrR family transcriptional regulator n=1 Tax=Neorhizobium sp. CSC1952 TaxID=2978974 RepID=UPI0025A544A5|nr:TetR/AcrR family transcriptional regulator [Rhizobium sp. CSC1952]WJR66329.1 TetR/AcrR family transcriptional regulator [Rhizobium sp. CSC1952]